MRRPIKSYSIKQLQVGMRILTNANGHSLIRNGNRNVLYAEITRIRVDDEGDNEHRLVVKGTFIRPGDRLHEVLISECEVGSWDINLNNEEAFLDIAESDLGIAKISIPRHRVASI